MEKCIIKNDSCRICSCSGKISTEFKSIFSQDETSGCDIASMMEALGDVKIAEDKFRSKVVCNDCVLKISIGYGIRRAIQMAEQATHVVEMLQHASDDDPPEDSIVVTEIKLEHLLEDNEEEFEYEFLEEEYLADNATVKSMNYAESEDSGSKIKTENVETKKSKRRDASPLESISKKSNIESIYYKTKFVMPNPEVILQKVDNKNYLIVEVQGDRCCGCSFVGLNRKQLLQHSNSEHAIEIIGSGNYCPICFIKFTNENTLTRHIDGSRSKSIYVCKTCERYFNSSRQFDAHLQQYNNCNRACEPINEDEDSSTSDEDLDEEFINEDNNWDYMMEEQSSNPIGEPKRPDRKTNNSKRFQQISEYAKSPYGVPFIQIDEKRIIRRLSFATFELMKLSGERCCGCEFTCDTRSQLFAHGQEAHGNREDILAEHLCVCPICRQCFENQKELSKHINCSTCKLLFLCTICNESFAGTDSLKFHQEHNENHSQTILELEQEHKPMVELKEANVVEAIAREFQQSTKSRNFSRSNNRSITKHRYLKMPDARFIDHIDHQQNHDVLTVCGERCCGCGEFFETVNEVQSHGQTTHLMENSESVGEYQCDVCFARFEWSRGLFMHKNAKRAVDTLFRCKTCNMLFSKRNRLEKHLQQAPNHPTAPSKQPTESEVQHDQKDENNGNFTKPDPPQQHKYYCCLAKCGQEFASEEMLLDHCVDHHTGKRRENEAERTNHQNVCPGCLKSFENTTCLVWHRFTRFTKQYTCRFCAQVFTRWNKYREHEDEVHLGKTHEYPCEKCDKIFRTPQRLKAHQETHSELRSEICDACGASFRNKGVLKRHRRTVHANDKPFVCQHCPKRLPTQEQLNAHLRVHTGAKPYTCRFCDRSFSHYTDRKRHEMSTHTGERPYQCPHCPAAYIRNRELSVHLQKHAEDDIAMMGTEV
ncbi:zinc finger protein 420-like [Armigeres subalbatus]|uniref:zinc finger protein 420-like n=1 Tax=Armigeres subalbatus TaxID=124917 RepID=UPI002ED5E93E